MTTASFLRMILTPDNAWKSQVADGPQFHKTDKKSLAEFLLKNWNLISHHQLVGRSIGRLGVECSFPNIHTEKFSIGFENSPIIEQDELYGKITHWFFYQARQILIFDQLRSLVGKKFAEFNVDWIGLKGPFLSQKIYLSRERSFGDIDLLVHPDSKQQCIRALQDLHFHPRSAQGKFSVNRHQMEFDLDPLNPSNGVPIELHLGWGKSLGDFSEAWSRRQISPIAKEAKGTEYTLSAEDEFVFLFYHGVVQHRLNKLVWLMDLVQYAYFARLNNLDVFSDEIIDRQLNERGWTKSFDIFKDLNAYILGAPPSTNLSQEQSEILLERLFFLDFDKNDFTKLQVRSLLMGGNLNAFVYFLKRLFKI